MAAAKGINAMTKALIPAVNKKEVVICIPLAARQTVCEPKIIVGMKNGIINTGKSKPPLFKPIVKLAPKAPMKLKLGVPTNRLRKIHNTVDWLKLYKKPINGAIIVIANPVVNQ